MKSGNSGVPMFHRWSVEAVHNMTECLKIRTSRSCAYDMTVVTHEHSRPVKYSLSKAGY